MYTTESIDSNALHIGTVKNAKKNERGARQKEKLTKWTLIPVVTSRISVLFFSLVFIRRYALWSECVKLKSCFGLNAFPFVTAITTNLMWYSSVWRYFILDAFLLSSWKWKNKKSETEYRTHTNLLRMASKSIWKASNWIECQAIGWSKMMMVMMNKKKSPHIRIHTHIEIHWQRERNKREMASRKLKANDVMWCDVLLCVRV